MWLIRNMRLALVAWLVLSPTLTAVVRGRQEEVSIGPDVSFVLDLLSPLSTSNNVEGDKFECKVLSPSEYAGAVVSGHIRKVKSAGKGKGKSELDLAFDKLTFADGRAGDFNAQITEVYEVENIGNEGRADTEGAIKGKSRVKISVKRAAAGAAAGAALGGIFGGPKGAAIGAAVGAGIGATTTLATEGPNLEFKAGTKFSVRTNARRRRPQ